MIMPDFPDLFSDIAVHDAAFPRGLACLRNRRVESRGIRQTDFQKARKRQDLSLHGLGQRLDFVYQGFRYGHGIPLYSLKVL